jgi:hypothetical protein
MSRRGRTVQRAAQFDKRRRSAGQIRDDPICLRDAEHGLRRNSHFQNKTLKHSCWRNILSRGFSLQRWAAQTAAIPMQTRRETKSTRKPLIMLESAE